VIHAASIAGWLAQVAAALPVQESAHAVANKAAAVSSGPSLALLIPAFPLLGFVLASLCAALRIKTKLPAWLSVLCLAGAFAVTVAVWQQVGTATAITQGFDWIHVSFNNSSNSARTLVSNFGLYLDPLTWLWMLFVTGLATLIGLYASEYMAGDVGAGYCRFYAAFNLFVFSMTCLVMADNLLLLYLGWEGVGLCSYLLIGYFYKKPSAVAAAKKAFIVNRIGDLGLAMGIMLAFVHFGTIRYSELFPAVQQYAAAAAEGRWTEIPRIVQFIPLLLMVGAFGKSAQGPLYVWLPDAMEGPTPVSALIHAATMVTAGVYLVARTLPLFAASEHALPIVAWVGTITALWAATIGMAQFDIKRIMAYSTVSQLGYMFAGLGVLTSVGGAFHVFTHAFFKALLFLSCGAVMHGFGGQLDLRKLSGVMKLKGWGIVGAGMLVGCLNLSGFPFTAGFFSKDMILAQAFANPNTRAIGWILLFTAGLTAYYTFRVFFRVFVGPVYFEPGDEVHGHAEADDHAHDHNAANSPHPGSPEGGGPEPHYLAAEAALAEKSKTGGHEDPHGHFHPHPPGWAINLVLALLALGSILAALTFFVGDAEGGWVGSMVSSSTAAIHSEHGAHAELFGRNPHEVMYYASSIVGLIGIGVAFWLHYAGRRTAATARADALLPALGPIARWAQNKWYVDEFYDFLIRKPLWVLSNIFHLIDRLLVDGLVNLVGALPRWFGTALRPSQSGELHGYAVGMAGGIGVILVIAWMVLSK
jgi:NADH-quinone oxidoreductase subunit L